MPAAQRDTMKLNDLQKKLLATYKGGEFAHIQRGEDLRNCGDALLLYLFNELGNDCFAEAREKSMLPQTLAIERLHRAAAHILDVIAVL